MASSSSSSSASRPSVLIVGSGIAGLACARALYDGGVSARVVDRGRVVGGRLATKQLDGRPVDTGARYFTAPDGSEFTAVVERWVSRGLARPWTDTFAVIDESGRSQPRTGPVRFSAPAGLRSLATELAESLRADGVSVEQGVEIASVSDEGDVVEEGRDGRYDTVVLAMPDPQAARMLAPNSLVAADLQAADDWQPTLSIVLGWAERHWPQDFHAAFVNDSLVVAFVADDGDRRGDGAPVLVVHTTTDFARQHLEHPDAAIAPVLDSLRSLLDITATPVFTFAKRWTFSLPGTQHPEPYLLTGRIAVCGDAWGRRSAVSTAWESGTALGRKIAAG